MAILPPDYLATTDKGAPWNKNSKNHLQLTEISELLDMHLEEEAY